MRGPVGPTKQVLIFLRRIQDAYSTIEGYNIKSVHVGIFSVMPKRDILISFPLSQSPARAQFPNDPDIMWTNFHPIRPSISELGASLLVARIGHMGLKCFDIANIVILFIGTIAKH
jgi:hypothetical protein